MIWDPQPSEYWEVIESQNPWHTLASVPTELAKPKERPLAQGLWKVLQKGEPYRHQLILGPRRVGKTTVMYQTVKRLLDSGVAADRLVWLRLDHPLLMQISLGEWMKSLIESSSATAQQPLYVFLDELVYADQWDLWLKTFYDDNWPIRIIATSSSTAALKDRRMESGVGRWEEQYLGPYSFSEFLGLTSNHPEMRAENSLSSTLDQFIEDKTFHVDLTEKRRRFMLVGGFPELLTAEWGDETTELLRSQRVLRADAVERAIYKDIPQAFGVHDPMKLERLLYMLAGQITGLLSPQSLSQSVGLTGPTLHRYIRFLEQAYLIFALPNYSASEESVQRRGRKLYFVDGAVRNAALQRGIAPMTDDREMGLLLENVAASHLHALSQQNGVRVYHWRHRGKHEVDLVYDDPNGPLALEIASSPSHSTAGLQEFQDRFPRFRGRCYLVSPGARPMKPKSESNQIGRLPIDLLLLAIGAQASRELDERLLGWE